MRKDIPRYMVPGGYGIEPHAAGLLYRREDVDPVLSDQAARIRELEAENKALREGRGVKPLGWDKNPDQDEWYGGEQEPELGLNRYQIIQHPCAIGYYVLEFYGNRFDKDFPSVNAAKEYAQSHHDDCALSPAPVSVGDDEKEGIIDAIEEIISETHDIDVTDRRYAENVVAWLERHHPAALRALTEREG